MRLFVSFLVFCSAALYAKPFPEDSLASKQSKVSLLIYSRTILEANGGVRFDQNIVANIKLNKWLRFEGGVRQGERPENLDSYFHYKIELQTKSFWNRARFIARLSDNIIQYPLPQYSKSNYLLIAETRWPVSEKFDLLLAGGYNFTFQKDNSTDVPPNMGTGVSQNFPTYKIAIRYSLKKGSLEAVYGAYDVFNPYLLSSPFLQLTFEHDITRRCELYSYLRYQYNQTIDSRQNDFLGLGVRIHL